jgi:pimeloyl-ACP methyl ester carboxylesterase
MLKFVLIHGAWHDGSCWDQVAAHLRNGGHVVHAPTIAGNGRNADRRVDHAVCTKSIVDFFVSEELGGVVLVGHSYGGTIIAKVAEAEPQRLRRLVNAAQGRAATIPFFRRSIWCATYFSTP